MQKLSSIVAFVCCLCCLQVTAASGKKHVQRQDSAEYHGSTSVTPGIPIAIIYDTNTSSEVRDNIDKAIRNINSDVKFGRNKWAVKLVTIDTSDNYELMQAVCQQMSRGVLAIFGTTSWSSMNTLNAFTNFYGVPFISWSHLARNRMYHYRLISDHSNMTISRKVRRFYRDLDEYSFPKRSNNFRTSRNNFEMETDYDIVDYSNNDELLMESLEIEDEEENVAEKDRSPAQLYLRPDLSTAMIELIHYYKWTSIYYIYNHEPAMVHLESLFDYQLVNSGFAKKILIRKIKNINNCRNMLRAIETSTDMNNVNEHENDKIIMIVDLDSKKSYLSFLSQIKDLGMTKTRYHYILATMGIYELDLNDFRHGGVTITGFSIVDYYSINTIKVLSDMVQNGEPLNKIANIPHEAALLIDGLIFFSRRVNSLIGSNMSRLFGMDNVSLRRAEIYIGKNKGMNCTYGLSRGQPKWPLGPYLLDKLKLPENGTYEGLTGPMSFAKDGRRRNFTIGIYKVGLNQPLAKIGYYSSVQGLKINDEKKSAERTAKVELKNRKLTIVSIKDDPFLMFRNEAGKNFTGNDRFTGYCADLAKRLSEMLNFTYELRLVKDNKFGARDNEGNWDGIVGELIRHEADIAVAPLTISSQRERVIEFSMPFMNIGISIMIKKPKKEKPGVFSFMEPLDSQIWLCVILAYIGVTIIMFLVSRFSPYEWHYDEKKNAIGLNNDFNFLNTLWFNLAAVMQQGVDLAPRSFSGRVVASVWWFFTLILISSYTANLAAFLTIERMVSPIESAEDLVKQSSIRYGTLEGGSTKEFFKNSRVPTYQRMWASMDSWKPSVFVKDNMEGFQRVRESKGKYAYLLESSLNEYLNERLPCDTMKVGNDLDSKGYGIATPIRSEWRDPINLAVLQLRKEGFLDSLKTKYWFDTSECGSSSGSSKDTSQSALNLINVAGIFYILIIGLILSVLVATLELMYKAKIQSEKNKIEFSEAVKSKMRLSISGYEDSIKDFRKKNGINEEANQLTPFPT